MRHNRHISDKPQPSEGSILLQLLKRCRHNLLQTHTKNFAYEMIELEMSIENQNGPSVYADKIQDISKLIQIYMAGVESLESCEDQRYQYFRKKLEALMLKKTVVCQLYKGAKSPDIPRKIGQQKRKQHEVQMFYNKQQHQKGKVKQLIANIDKKLQKFSGTVKKQMKTQQQNIQQRIRLRKLRSDNGSICKMNLNGINNKMSDLDDLPTQNRALQKRIQQYKSQKHLGLNSWKEV